MAIQYQIQVIYGGFQIGIHNGTRWVTERVPCPPGTQLVMFIPDFIGKTSAARGVLKDTISRNDAAFNIGRVAFLVHALAMGNLDNLKWGVQDRMHQPQRADALYKHLYPMIKAAEEAGAWRGRRIAARARRWRARSEAWCHPA